MGYGIPDMGYQIDRTGTGSYFRPSGIEMIERLWTNGIPDANGIRNVHSSVTIIIYLTYNNLLVYILGIIYIKKGYMVY